MLLGNGKGSDIGTDAYGSVMAGGNNTMGWQWQVILIKTRSMPIAGGTRDDSELAVAREEDGPAGGMRWISSGRWYKEDGPPVVGGNGAKDEDGPAVANCGVRCDEDKLEMCICCACDAAKLVH